MSRPSFPSLFRCVLLASFTFVATACESSSPDAPPTAFVLDDLGLDDLPACTTDASCDSAHVCEPRYRRCVECLFDADCDAESRCDMRRCVSRDPCTTAADCADDPVGRRTCDSSDGRCVGCLDDSECDAGSICDGTRCAPGARCVNSLDCGDDSVCDRNSHTCVECTLDADCDEGETCSAHSCRIDCESDHDCVASGALCDTTRAFCVECVHDEDCPGAYHCDDARCVLDVCVVGESHCTNGGFSTCLTDGRGYGFVSCADQQASCTSTSEGGAACTPWTCTPNATSCDPNTHELVTCSADGLTSAHAPCASGKACEAGQCLPTICTPNGTFCQGGDAFVCNASGTAAIVTAECGANRCEAAPTAHCVPYACTPAAPSCVGGVAGTCNAAGTGLAAGGTDCAATDSACSNGQCIPHVCEPGTTFCQNNAIYMCSANGLSSSYSTGCWNGQCAAQGGTASCVPVVCSPGQSICQGNDVVTCNAAGTAYENPVACAGYTGACDAGSCRPTICTPNAYYCEDNRLLHCSASGGSSSVADVCSPSYNHCEAGKTSCTINACSPNAPACDGNSVRTCNADGSGYTGATTACAQGTGCSGGACYTQTCTPGAYACMYEGYPYYATSPKRCSANGLAWESVAHCTYYQGCSVATQSCTTPICTANATRCSGDVVETCSADRLSWVTTNDCGAMQQLCSGSTCIAQQLETIAPSTYTSYRATDALRGAYIRVTSDRSLGRIEANLAITNGTSSTLTWVVYESLTELGPFLPIATQDTTAAGTGAFAWYGSNPLGVTLRAGRYYAIGVLASGAASYYYVNTDLPQTLSFGVVYSGLYENGTTPPAEIVGQTRGVRYQQRLTLGAAPP